MEPRKNNLGFWLTPTVKQKNFTITDFCTRLGVTRRTYYNYLEGTRTPSKATLLKMSEILDMAPKELLEQCDYNHQSCWSHRIENFPPKYNDNYDPNKPHRRTRSDNKRYRYCDYCKKVRPMFMFSSREEKRPFRCKICEEKNGDKKKKW